MKFHELTKRSQNLVHKILEEQTKEKGLLANWAHYPCKLRNCGKKSLAEINVFIRTFETYDPRKKSDRPIWEVKILRRQLEGLLQKFESEDMENINTIKRLEDRCESLHGDVQRLVQERNELKSKIVLTQN